VNSRVSEKHTVDIRFTRVEQALDTNEVERHTMQIRNAVCQERGGVLYVSYEDPKEEPAKPDGRGSGAASRSRTTLKILPDALTMIRHGQVEWTHTFRQGEVHSSAMRVGGMRLPIQTKTEQLVIRVDGLKRSGGQGWEAPRGGQSDAGERMGHGAYQGSIDVTYHIDIGGNRRRVELSIRFRSKS
jgi:uncharacterized beta-barrel protein YwiB (DUF1934 family)